MAYSAETIAKWFVAWAETDESGEAELSNLKLQKLLYYAQGHHLARTGRPLFDDPIEAWDHGPVVPAVYHNFKNFESHPLTLDPDDPFDWDHVSEETTQLLIDVWERYGEFAAWKLRNMTHAEAPWVDAYQRRVSHIEITQDALRRYFATL